MCMAVIPTSTDSFLLAVRMPVNIDIFLVYAVSKRFGVRIPHMRARVKASLDTMWTQA